MGFHVHAFAQAHQYGHEQGRDQRREAAQLDEADGLIAGGKARAGGMFPPPPPKRQGLYGAQNTTEEKPKDTCPGPENRATRKLSKAAHIVASSMTVPMPSLWLIRFRMK